VCPRGHLLHLAGSRDDEEVAASFKAATFIGTALALEVKAIASPDAMVRKKSMLRMKISPEVSATNDAPFQFHACRAASVQFDGYCTEDTIGSLEGSLPSLMDAFEGGARAAALSMNLASHT
jgi:hypothetical protein